MRYLGEHPLAPHRRVRRIAHILRAVVARSDHRMADSGRDDKPKGRCRVGDRAPCALSSGNRPRTCQFVESDAWRLVLG